MCYLCNYSETELKIKILNPKAKVPTKREEDSGYDVYGVIEDKFLAIASGNNVIIGTGIATEFPKGLGLIAGNRGSVGTKSALVGAHVIDSGYRGEIKINLHNVSDRYIFITDLSLEELIKEFLDPLREKFPKFYIDGVYDEYFKNVPIIISKSNALMQVMIIPTLHLPIKVVDELSYNTDRKENAFGSTNIIFDI